MTGTGNTSVEVFAKIIGEDLLTGERYIAATSFLTFVALPDDRENFEMPEIVPESDEEKFLCAGYEKRKEERMVQRDLDKELQAAKKLNELCFVEVKSSIGSRDDLGRPTISALDNKLNFVNYLKNI